MATGNRILGEVFEIHEWMDRQTNIHREKLITILCILLLRVK